LRSNNRSNNRSNFVKRNKKNSIGDDIISTKRIDNKKMSHDHDHDNDNDNYNTNNNYSRNDNNHENDNHIDPSCKPCDYCFNPSSQFTIQMDQPSYSNFVNFITGEGNNIYTTINDYERFRNINNDATYFAGRDEASAWMAALFFRPGKPGMLTRRWP